MDAQWALSGVQVADFLRSLLLHADMHTATEESLVSACESHFKQSMASFLEVIKAEIERFVVQQAQREVYVIRQHDLLPSESSSEPASKRARLEREPAAYDWTIPFAIGEDLRTRCFVQFYNNGAAVELRAFREEGDDMLPTDEGVMLSVAEWQALLPAITGASSAAALPQSPRTVTLPGAREVTIARGCSGDVRISVPPWTPAPAPAPPHTITLSAAAFRILQHQADAITAALLRLDAGLAAAAAETAGMGAASEVVEVAEVAVDDIISEVARAEAATPHSSDHQQAAGSMQQTARSIQYAARMCNMRDGAAQVPVDRGHREQPAEEGVAVQAYDAQQEQHGSSIYGGQRGSAADPSQPARALSKALGVSLADLEASQARAVRDFLDMAAAAGDRDGDSAQHAACTPGSQQQMMWGSPVWPLGVPSGSRKAMCAGLRREGDAVRFALGVCKEKEQRWVPVGPQAVLSMVQFNGLQLKVKKVGRAIVDEAEHESNISPEWRLCVRQQPAPCVMLRAAVDINSRNAPHPAGWELRLKPLHWLVLAAVIHRVKTCVTSLKAKLAR